MKIHTINNSQNGILGLSMRLIERIDNIISIGKVYEFKICIDLMRINTIINLKEQNTLISTKKI